MKGTLFILLGQPVPSYFLLLVTGFIFATVIGALWAKRVGQDPDVVVNLGLAMLIAGVVGGRLLHVVADGYFWDYVHLCTDPVRVDWHITQGECGTERYPGTWDVAKAVCHPTPHQGALDVVSGCLAWAKIWGGGFAYYGGLIVGSATAWYLLRVDRFPFWKAADMAGMVVPVGLGFGRLGCLLAGCCFGKPTAGPLGLTFPSHSPASEWQYKEGLLPTPFSESLPVHATQVWESVGSLAIAAFCLLWLHGRKRYDGQVFLAFVGLYAVLRFVLEIWRSDDRGAVAGLTTSQLVGLGLVVAVVLVNRKLQARTEARLRPAV